MDENLFVFRSCVVFGKVVFVCDGFVFGLMVFFVGLWMVDIVCNLF